MWRIFFNTEGAEDAEGVSGLLAKGHILDIRSRVLCVPCGGKEKLQAPDKAKFDDSGRRS